MSKCVPLHHQYLIPAHAGVILRSSPVLTAMETYPRARGGDPNNQGKTSVLDALSPRTRG